MFQLTRREILRRAGGGFGMIGLAGALNSAGLLSTAQAATNNTSATDPAPLAKLGAGVPAPHFAPRAK